MNKQETAHWLLTAGLTVGVVASLSIGEYNRQQLELSMQEQAVLCKAQGEQWRLEATGRDMVLLGELNEARELLGLEVINTGIAE